MFYIFIEIQAYENERISEYLNIFNTISHKKKVSFLPKDTKKKFHRNTVLQNFKN